MKLNTTLSTLAAVATVSASALLGTGCQTTGGNKGPQYAGYLDPEAKNFAAQKEAFENQGNIVEATFIPDPANPGKMKAVYGVRERGYLEGFNATMQKYAPTRDTIFQAGQLTLGTMDTVNGFRQVSATKDVANSVQSAGTKVTNAVNEQTKQQKNGIETLGTLIQSIGGMCNQ